MGRRTTNTERRGEERILAFIWVLFGYAVPSEEYPPNIGV